MEPDPGSIVRVPSIPPILWLKISFSLVQQSSHLTIRLYAKRSAHPDILIGTHEMPIPRASQSGSFFSEFPFLSILSTSRVQISHVSSGMAQGELRGRHTRSHSTYQSTSHLRTCATVYRPKMNLPPLKKLLFLNAFKILSLNIFYPRRINPSTLVILYHRVGKRCRLLVPRILVLLYVGPIKSWSGLSPLTDRIRGKMPSEGSNG